MQASFEKDQDNKILKKNNLRLSQIINKDDLGIKVLGNQYTGFKKYWSKNKARLSARS